MNEIKPCPFCGESQKLIVDTTAVIRVSIYCQNCGAGGPLRDTDYGAIAAWNNPVSFIIRRELKGMPIELKPCPFCDASATHESFGDGLQQIHRIVCTKCNLSIDSFDIKTVFNLWNRRINK